jgi:hypothetical protein
VNQTSVRRTWAGLGLTTLAIVGVVGCETAKSSNPLSPSIAGPIPGVTISAPRPLEPGPGSEVDATRQPITLLLENATSTGVRPLNYLVEIATDVQFTSKVFTREGITPGAEGRTSIRMPDALAADRTYYWRARAQDGANTGPYSAPANFLVYTPIVLDVPVPVSPISGQTISGSQPTFVFRNAARSGPVGAVRYTVQVAAAETFAAVLGQFDVAAQPSQEKVVGGITGAGSTTYIGRVRA